MKAVNLKPDYSEAYNNLGNTKLKLGFINEAVEKSDFSMVNDLLEVLKKPFEYNKKLSFSDPPKPNEDIKNTFCGT